MARLSALAAERKKGININFASSRSPMYRFEQEETEATESKSPVSSVYSFHSLYVGSGEDQPRYAVGQFRHVEVDDQSQRNIKQFHI